MAYLSIFMHSLHPLEWNNDNTGDGMWKTLFQISDLLEIFFFFWYKWYKLGIDKNQTMYKSLSGGLRCVGVQNKQADGLKVEEHEQNTEMQWPVKPPVTVRDSFY